MTPAIVIEVSPAGPSPTYAEAMIESCVVAAKGQMRCVLASEQKMEGADAVALVTWSNGPRVRAHLEVGLRAGPAQTWHERDIAFAATDPEIERWRAVGFAIATLTGDSTRVVDPEVAASEATSREGVGSRSADDGTRPNAEALPPPSPVSPTRPPRPIAGGEATTPRPLEVWSVDARLTLDAGISATTLVPGAEVRLERRWIGPWFALASLHGSLDRVDAFSIVRFQSGAGLGIVASPEQSPIRIAGQAELLLQVIHASGMDPSSGALGQSDRFLIGARESVDVSWMPSHAWGIVVGAAISEWGGTTDIVSHRRVVSSLPIAEFVGGLGLRFVLP